MGCLLKANGLYSRTTIGAVLLASKLLGYLKKRHPQRYQAVIQRLGLRR